MEVSPSARLLVPLPLNVVQSVALRYPSADPVALLMPIVPDSVIGPPVNGPLVATLVSVPPELAVAFHTAAPAEASTHWYVVFAVVSIQVEPIE